MSDSEYKIQQFWILEKLHKVRVIYLDVCEYNTHNYR